jgi:hypothetical protein
MLPECWKKCVDSEAEHTEDWHVQISVWQLWLKRISPSHIWTTLYLHKFSWYRKGCIPTKIVLVYSSNENMFLDPSQITGVYFLQHQTSSRYKVLYKTLIPFCMLFRVLLLHLGLCVGLYPKYLK